MAPQYKLHYFDLRGRAESIRLMFRAAGIPFEDVRIKREDWPSHKPNYPYGKVPVLEVDGKMLCQTNAINRYVAKLSGFMGNDDWENAEIDELGDVMTDFFGLIGVWMFEKNEDRKKELREKVDNEGIRPLIERTEKRLQDSKSGYLVSSKATWIDFVIFEQLLTYAEDHPAFLKGQSHIHKFMRKISEEASIKDYIANRSPKLKEYLDQAA